MSSVSLASPAAGRGELPVRPLVVVDLDDADDRSAAGLQRAVAALERAGGPVAVGVRRRPWTQPARRLASRLDVTVTSQPDPPRYAVPVADADAALERIARRAGEAPRAAAALCHVLRTGGSLPVPEALVLESLAYSMLLAGPEFRAWRSAHPSREPLSPADPVRLERDSHRLTVTLDHPERRNAFGRAMRDGLIEALELAAADRTVRQVHLRGAGPVFCSGGDLDEFGRADDVALAHLVRLRRSAGLAVHEVADRVVAHLHGHCVGAGIELPAFARRVRASPNTRIRLPELGMGLIPGAGGTVSVPRRIGRWRTAYLALSGDTLTAPMALRWGLADEPD